MGARQCTGCLRCAPALPPCTNTHMQCTHLEVSFPVKGRTEGGVVGDDGLPQRRLVCWREQAVGKRQLQGPVLGQNAGLGRLCVKPQA